MGLYLQRTYNHHWSAAGVFGHHWLSNLDYSLAFSAGDAVAWAQRPDGNDKNERLLTSKVPGLR
ncbi:hypothetical protein D9M71_790860 [compost metagenome]